MPATVTARPPVAAVGSAMLPPSVSINASPASGDSPLTVSFGIASALDGRTIQSWSWDFNDPASGSANTSTAQNPSHVFVPPGNGKTFTVSLTVTDSFGMTNTATKGITVNVPGPPLPTAEFSMLVGEDYDLVVASGSSVLAPQTVSFDGSWSHDDNNDAVASYEWDFGDTGNGVGVSPTHIYTNPGTYTVRLTVTATNSAIHYTEKILVVKPFSPPTDFRLTSAHGSFPLWPGGDGDFYFAWTNPPGSPGDRFEYEIEVSAQFHVCLAFGTKTRTVQGGAPGTTQAYDFDVNYPWYAPGLVCNGYKYDYRLKSLKRISPTDGESYLGPLFSGTVTV